MNRNKRQHAMAQASVMLVLMVVLAVILIGYMGTGGLSQDRAQAQRAMAQRGDQYVAQTLAESGVRLALQWLVEQPLAPTQDTAFAPSSVAPFFGGTTQGSWTRLTVGQGPTAVQLGGVPQVTGEIAVKFYPYASNLMSGRKLFAIESVGDYRGKQFLIRVYARQNTFARYAYFSDFAPTSWWITGLVRFQGPVHINGILPDGSGIDPAARVHMIWRQDGAVPEVGRRLFTYSGADYFTTCLSASQLDWNRTNGNITWSEHPTVLTWDSITAAGSSPLVNQPRITLPVATTAQAQAALGGSTPPAANTVGVLVPVTGGAVSGGLYISGDVRDLNLRTTGANQTSQILEFYQFDPALQADIRTTITLDPSQSTTHVVVEQRSNSNGSWNIQPHGSWNTTNDTVYTGLPNGVVFIDGNVGEQAPPYRGGLSGAVANSLTDNQGMVVQANALTLVTAANKNIQINGGIVYQNLITDASEPENLRSTQVQALNTSGVLGIIAQNIKIVDEDDAGRPLTDVSVHGVCMAYGTFNASNPTTRPPGVFSLLGGYVVSRNGTFGIALPNGSVQNGFLVNRNYDARVADNPPPAYPTTDHSYQIISYQRSLTPLH